MLSSLANDIGVDEVPEGGTAGHRLQGEISKKKPLETFGLPKTK